MKFIDKQLAIKLKEKGFDRPCLGFYNPIQDELQLYCANNKDVTYKNILTSVYKNKVLVDAPTIEQVLEWLREDCGLYISMACSRNYDIDADGRELGSWVYWWYEIYSYLSADLIYQEEEKEYDTYDEAILEGIEYVINNLI